MPYGPWLLTPISSWGPTRLRRQLNSPSPSVSVQQSSARGPDVFGKFTADERAERHPGKDCIQVAREEEVVSNPGINAVDLTGEPKARSGVNLVTQKLKGRVQMADSTASSEPHIPDKAEVEREGLVQPGHQFLLIERGGQQGLEKGTDLQGDPMQVDDHLVAVPVVFSASVTRGSGRRRRGMRGAGRRGLKARK
ncbi:UNVERIFIED_CONTAM: hypothetical protein Slati_1714200 [Sesamum latifolium]|uniref:Uncharacterized protein n=1 Tax=Sesamum latifolium TaxID=2727402 RepID=A0AAW2WWP7_9LAMI